MSAQVGCEMAREPILPLSKVIEVKELLPFYEMPQSNQGQAKFRGHNVI
jgi:hypothetical protein